MRFPTLLAAAALALSAAASAAAAQPAAPPSVVGTYELVSLNGDTLDPEVPGEPGWMVSGGTITLHEGGRMQLEVRAHKGDDPVQVRSVSGLYTLTGDEMVVRLSEDPSSTPERIRFTVRDGRLVGRDGEGNEMVFRRR
jgi:hypothetical protein